MFFLCSFICSVVLCSFIITLAFLLFILCTFSPQCHSQKENGCNSLCKPIMSVKLTQSLGCRLVTGIWGSLASVYQPPLCQKCWKSYNHLISSIPQSKFLRAGSLAFSVKHIFSSALLVYRFFELNVHLWWIRPVGGLCRVAGGVNNLLVYLRFNFLTK